MSLCSALKPMRNFVLLLLAFLAACQQTTPTDDETAPAATQVLLANGTISELPEVDAHRQALEQARLSEQIVLPLSGLQGAAARAQELARLHPFLQENLRSDDGNHLRAEVFSVFPLRQSDLSTQWARCRPEPCMRVEIYDYARNRTLIAVVDPELGEVLSWRAELSTQPELPEHLKQLATLIAIRSPEVSEALGGIKPEAEAALMASTKSALNGTRCERSKHLCVAPTFVQGNIAIWAIVDLTDLKLVGVQWTELGMRDPLPPTEQSLSDAALMAGYCERNTELKRAGWQLNYMLTASDGLRISEVRFNGIPVLNSAKLVDWHVSYSEREGFGYSDAVGCPNFSSAAVIPFAPPSVRPLQENGVAVGFELVQEFRSAGWPGPCNYSYRQSYQFFDNGSFRPTATSIGAGCGSDGTYRPVLRIEPAGDGWVFSAWDGKDFATIDNERWLAPEAAVASNGARFGMRNAQLNYQIIPGRGQFADGRHGDSEWFYLTARHADRDEGASDMLTIGPCCNSDFAQGPEKFIDSPPEALGGQAVLWYVPQLKNATEAGKENCWARSELQSGVYQVHAYPCTGGPLFALKP